MLRRLLGVARLERRVAELSRENVNLIREGAEFEGVAYEALERINQRIDALEAVCKAEVQHLRDKIKALECECADLSITVAELELRMIGLREGPPPEVQCEAFPCGFRKVGP